MSFFQGHKETYFPKNMVSQTVRGFVCQVCTCYLFSCSSHILGLVRGSGLAHQSDLSSKAPGSSVLQKTRHSVVVEVVNEVSDSCLVSRSQLVCSQRGQRGTCSPRPTAIVITGGAQGQLRLERGEGEI